MKLSRLPPGFALDTAAQGLALRQEAVQDVKREWTDTGWRAEGTVMDGGRAYGASVELTPPPEPQLHASACTCGRYRCRHVAALVLATDPPPGEPPTRQAPATAPEEPLDPRLQQWLESFGEETPRARGRQFELRYVLRLLPPAANGGAPGGAGRAALQLLRVPVRGDVPPSEFVPLADRCVTMEDGRLQ